MLVFGRRLERMPVTPSLLTGQALSASFGSGSTAAEILRYAQDDRQGFCHPEHREGSGEMERSFATLRMTAKGFVILSVAKDDSDRPDPSQACSREAFSPNVYIRKTGPVNVSVSEYVTS